MSNIQSLPPKNDLESKAVLKKAAEAHRFLAELKGIAATIPNQQILFPTIDFTFLQLTTMPSAHTMQAGHAEEKCFGYILCKRIFLLCLLSVLVTPWQKKCVL